MNADEAMVLAERLLTEAVALIPAQPDGRTVYEVGADHQRIDMRTSTAAALISLAGLKVLMGEPIAGTVHPAQATRTARCGHHLLCLLNGDHWLHVASMARCANPPVTDGPIPPVTEAP